MWVPHALPTLGCLSVQLGSNLGSLDDASFRGVDRLRLCMSGLRLGSFGSARYTTPISSAGQPCNRLAVKTTKCAVDFRQGT